MAFAPCFSTLAGIVTREGTCSPFHFQGVIMKIDAHDIKVRAAGRWDHILSALAPQLLPALNHPGRHTTCPIHGGKSDFRVYRDVAETGGGICTCGSWPDGFALLGACNDWLFPHTLQEVARFLLGPEPIVPVQSGPRGKPAHQDSNIIRANLKRFWDSAQKSGQEMEEVLWLYFFRRGLRTSPLTLRDIRYHPQAFYHSDGAGVSKFPAMLACVRDLDGNPVSIHRTFLTKEGEKAPVEFPKKLMPTAGCLKGAAIRLAPTGKDLAVAEGIETSIAVMEMTRMPCWCVLNAGLMAHFVPPPGVEHLHIFADRDRPSKQHPGGHGLESARALAKRIRESGSVEVSVALPPLPIPEGQKGVDWLDVVSGIRRKP
jgi:phage/plasmid primase-like uncharacterized protein